MMRKKRKSGSVAAPKEELPLEKIAATEEEEVLATNKKEEGWRRRAGLMVSEQIPVGAMWLPSWDVGVMAESYIASLYSDVWDGYDDIWGLRSPSSDHLPPTHPTTSTTVSTSTNPPNKASLDPPLI